MVESGVHIPRRIGSIPVLASKQLGYSQVGKAVDFDSTIPWFESRYPSQLLSHQYLLDASTRVELITLLSISCEGIMIAGVNIDVAVVQLVELEIVILVVMGSTPIGHPNSEAW